MSENTLTAAAIALAALLVLATFQRPDTVRWATPGSPTTTYVSASPPL